MSSMKEYAKLALSCLDLTSLGEKDTDDKIKALCDKAVGNYGAVAAVCIFPKFIKLAKQEMDGTDVKIATVVNFPAGSPSIGLAIDETREALDFGADEIDLVFPYKAFLHGNREIGKEMVKAVKSECGDKKLKVIIESGELAKALHISNAAKDCIEAGADFIKTSTGMVAKGASPEAANAMIEAIRDSGKKIGFKASGGVKSLEDARDYMVIASSIMGDGYINPDNFRIGASKLMDELIKELGY